MRTGVSLCADLEPVAASMTSKTSGAPAEAPLTRIAGPRGICHGMLVAASKRGPSVITNDAGLERIAAGTGGSASPDCDSRDRHCSSSSQATMSSAPCPATGSPGGAALSRSAASSVLPLLNLSSAQASSELSCFARERRSGVGARPRLLRERRVRLSDVDGRAGDRSSFNAVTRCLDGGASLCAKLTLQSVLSTQPTIVRGGGRGVSRASEWKTLRAGTWAPGFVLSRARRRGRRHRLEGGRLASGVWRLAREPQDVVALAREPLWQGVSRRASIAFGQPSDLGPAGGRTRFA